MKKRLLVVLVVIVVVLGIGGYFALRNRGAQQPTYQTMQATMGDVKEVVSGTGNLEADKTYQVLTQGQGVIDRLSVKTGDTVNLGQELLRIGGKPIYAIKGDSPIYRQIGSDDTGDDVKWVQQSLKDMGYSNTVDSDFGSGTIGALNNFQSDKGLTETSKIGPDTFQTFPLPLVVMDVAVEQGQSVTANTVAMTLANPSSLNVVVNVNEIDLPKIKVGQSVDITADALPGKTFQGKVSSISPGLVTSQSSSGQQSSGSSSSSSQSGVVNYPVTINLVNSDPGLRAGMTANADIVVDSKANVLTIPTSAVRSRGNQKFVLIPGDKGSPQMAQIEVGISSDSVSEIVSGIDEGQQVVVGLLTLGNGSGNGQSGQNGGFRGPFGGGGPVTFGGPGQRSSGGGSQGNFKQNGMGRGGFGGLP